MNTPGSTVDRTVRIGYFVDRKTNSLEAELVTPWTNLLAKGKILYQVFFMYFASVLENINLAI